MPMKKKITVHTVRRVQKLMKSKDKPKLEDYVLASVILARRDQMEKDELLLLVGDVWDASDEG